MRYLLSILIVLSGYASAHEWTPTYPIFNPSAVEGINVSTMKLFNAREDVEYFEIGVFDEDWNGVPFAVIGDNIIRVKHQEIKYIDVYIRRNDMKRAVYVCSKSKPLAEDTTKPMLFSRICSKIK